MKKFIFTLEVLQSTKMVQEKEIRKELAEIETRLSEQVLILESIEKDMAGLVRSWQTRMVSGLNATSLQQFNNSFSQLRENQVTIQSAIRRIDQEKTACQERLISLMTDLKGLETLRDQQLEQYKHDLAREAENEISEFVTYHRKSAVTVNS